MHIYITKENEEIQMAGTHASGLKAARTNRSLYGSNYYQLIGAMGGTKSRGGGVTGDPVRAREIGKLGGRVRNSGWKLSEETKAKMSATHKARWAERKKETFFIMDDQIDNHIIEPFVKGRFWDGWFKRRQP